MKRTASAVVVLCAGILGFAGSAAAQGTCGTSGTLTQVVGNVVVDQGAGFKSASVGSSLKAGDKVAVRGPGNAVVDFGSQRLVTVTGSTTRVIQAPGCAFVPNDVAKIVVPTMILVGGVWTAVEISDNKKNRFIPISP
ncbi:hypothetical protein [Ancylobacter sp. TS-1]|uniref:hypothetical protein n=1 Tax=Ancylobacter sp. TS-1 TaxID=1850374 RepID=UPI001265ABCA|nr:hypothetical protein [Ancylobacter sp. TS-1]QFR33444.1 hypothetical protein GBB76_10045 [Ancylobacter sp. TS-1]